jgi:hypothetical protein
VKTGVATGPGAVLGLTGAIEVSNDQHHVASPLEGRLCLIAIDEYADVVGCFRAFRHVGFVFDNSGVERLKPTA